jgi:hypothetical protein
MLPRKLHRALSPPLNPHFKPFLSKRRHKRLLQPLNSTNHDPKESYFYKPTNMRQQRAHRLSPQRIPGPGIAKQQDQRIQKPIHFRSRRAIRRLARVHLHHTHACRHERGVVSAIVVAVVVIAVVVAAEEVAAQDGGDGAEVLRCGVRAQPGDVVFCRDEVRVNVQVERRRVREGEEVRGGEGVGCCGEEGEEGVDRWGEVVAEVDVDCLGSLGG